ncbi:MAG TPA: DMT family transporter [Firmicutes bacterium]|nr:DMT family transporter [Bacillota bacterium]
MEGTPSEEEGNISPKPAASEGLRAPRLSQANRRRLADASLLLVTVIWGSTFPLIKNLVVSIDPMVIIAIRFLIASILMAFVLFKKLRSISHSLLMAGAVLGGFLFSGYALQTIGLKYTTASKAGFITGLSVVMVPFLSAMILHRTPGKTSIMGAILAAIGLGLMAIEPGSRLTLQIGDVLVFLCALGFAFHIVFVARYAPAMDVPLLVLVQVTVAAVIGLAYTAIVGDLLPVFKPPGFGWVEWGSLIFLGAFATAGAFFVQNSAQRITTPTRVAIILAAEPIFSALFAWIFLGESLGIRGIFGAALIIVGILGAELG